MKNLLSFCLFLVFLSCSKENDQAKNVFIKTQEDLDAFMNENKGKSVLKDNIFLQPEVGNKILDLSAFEKVTKISGDLRISSFKVNINLSQLKNLEEVRSLTIEDSPGLVSISLPNLKYVEYILISRNEQLKNLEFSSVSRVKDVLIFDNVNLETLYGFTFLDTIHDITLSNCKIREFSGFQNLKSCNNILINFSKIAVDKTSFINLHTANNISFITKENGKDFSWLKNLRSYKELAFVGPIDIKDLCVIKTSLLNPNFKLFSSYNNNDLVYTSSDIEKLCN